MGKFLDEAEMKGPEAKEEIARAAGVEPGKLSQLMHANSEIFTRVVLACDRLTRDVCTPETYEHKRALTKFLLGLCDRLDRLRARL